MEVQVRRVDLCGSRPQKRAQHAPLLFRPENTFLVFRAIAKAGTRPALAHAAWRLAFGSLTRIAKNLFDPVFPGTEPDEPYP